MAKYDTMGSFVLLIMCMSGSVFFKSFNKELKEREREREGEREREREEQGQTDRQTNTCTWALLDVEISLLTLTKICVTFHNIGCKLAPKLTYLILKTSS